MISVPANFTAANAALAKQPIYLIEIAGYSRAFTNYYTGVAGQYEWVEDIQDLTISVSDMDGGANIGDLIFTVQDRGGAVTGDFPGFTFEGKVVTLKTGFVGMSQADFATLFTGKVDTVVSANDNNSYTFTCVDKRNDLQKTIYATADDGASTDNAHRKTLNGHPLDLLVSALTSEVGVLLADIDTTKIYAYRDGIFNGVRFSLSLDGPVTAKDFLEQQIMKPLGGYMWPNSLGQVSVNFFYPSTVTPVDSITEDHMLETPTAEQCDIVNTVEFKFDRNSDGTFLADSVQTYAPSTSLFGQFGAVVIESYGMKSGLQGFFLAALTARTVFVRYGLKTLKFDSSPLALLWSKCVFEPGDILAVTNAHIPDRKAGVIGIASKLFEVLDRTWKFSEGVAEYTALDATGLQKFGTFLIAPNSQANYVPSSSSDKHKYMFMCNGSDQYSNGDAANVLD